MNNDLLTDRVSLIRNNGNRIDDIPASVQGNRIFVGDTSIQMEEGDILIRKLQNGLEEKYFISNLNYYEDKLLGHIKIGVKKETKIQTHVIPPTVHDFEINLNERDSVFIVHGREDSTKAIIAQFLKDLGLEPIILHEQANKGRTIIEKFEDHSSNVKYAVILLTPDDIGGLKSEPTRLSPRARQNVVFEMGHFFGSLGRRNVCALLSPGVEPPSDIESILYIPLDQNDKWKDSLFRELKEAKLKLRDWIDPQIEKIAEGLYKDGFNISLGQMEEKPWTMLDEEEKKTYRLQAKELLEKVFRKQSQQSTCIKD